MVITGRMKHDALSKAPAGWYTSICPKCGLTCYTMGRDDGKRIIDEKCNTAFVPLDMGEMMHFYQKEGKPTTEPIRKYIRGKHWWDDDCMGKTVTVSVCPVCNGFAWTFDGNTVTCADCKPDHMIVDTFVL